MFTKTVTLITLLHSLVFFSLQAQIQLLNDEFEHSASMINWRNINETEQWGIQQLERLDINTSMAGHLEMMPYTVTWFEAYRGPLIYKEVTGDFVFTANVAIAGRNQPIPAGNLQFNLAGVMCRIPIDYPNGALGMGGWQATDQNYIFLAIGGANNGDGRCDPSPHPCLAPHLEVKTTINGNSDLDIEDIGVTEAQFRFARIGQVFIILYKLVNSNDWIVHRRYDRNDFPETAQIGFVTYTNWPKADSYDATFHNSHTLNSDLDPDPTSHIPFNPDVIGDFDFARFDSLAIPPALVGRDFFNPMSVSNSELLSFLDYDSEAFCPMNLHIHSEIDSNAFVQMQADETITMDTTVLANSAVEVYAGMTVRMLPGFAVAAGSDFTARIEGCSGVSLAPSAVSENVRVGQTQHEFSHLNLTTSPNPFLHTTNIEYTLPKTEQVSLKIYDVNGRLVQILLNQTWQAKGRYQFQFQPTNTQGHLFYLVLTTTENVLSKPLMVLE